MLKKPQGEEMEKRLYIVLKVIYLLFNEGYNCSSGDQLIREELCRESFRLGEILAASEFNAHQDVHALLSLMYFHASRFKARVGKKGELLSLKEQDRTRWDTDMIAKGYASLQKSMVYEGTGEYQLHALISACHCYAKSYEATDWKLVLALYDALHQLKPSPVVALNRLIPYSMVYGAPAAMEAFQKLEEEKVLHDYYLKYAVRGELNLQLGNTEEAIRNYGKAMQLTENYPEKAYLEKKIRGIFCGG